VIHEDGLDRIENGSLNFRCRHDRDWQIARSVKVFAIDALESSAREHPRSVAKVG
jgi:hypothetical protein